MRVPDLTKPNTIKSKIPLYPAAALALWTIMFLSSCYVDRTEPPREQELTRSLEQYSEPEPEERFRELQEARESLESMTEEREGVPSVIEEITESSQPAAAGTDATTRPPRSIPKSDSVAPVPRNAVDLLLETLDFAPVAFNAPEEMNLGQNGRILVVIDPAGDFAEFDEFTSRIGEIVEDEVQVTTKMSAELSGTLGLQVNPTGPQPQLMTMKESTKWWWDVTAIERGSQTLRLTIRAHAQIEGFDSRRDLETYHREIDVRVTVEQRVLGFIRRNWEWLWTVLLVPIGGWIWARLRRQAPMDRTPEGGDPE